MQYLIQKKFPKDIADLICEYLPTHPMKAKIMHWSITRSRQTHFNKWYFSGVRYKDFKNKRERDNYCLFVSVYIFIHNLELIIISFMLIF